MDWLLALPQAKASSEDDAASSIASDEDDSPSREEESHKDSKERCELLKGVQLYVILAQNAGEEICDLAEAECREERRWMQRENEKVARRYKQQERDRIAKLVSLAEAADPRVQAEVEAERKQREAEEAARKVPPVSIASADLTIKEGISEERVKKCRQRLRGFHQAVKQHVVLDQEDELRSLGDRIDEALKGKDVFAAAELFHEASRREEQEKLRREQQKEESRLRAIEQSEKDKQQAQQKKQEPSRDLADELTKLDAMSDEKLSASLQEAIQSDAALAGAQGAEIRGSLEMQMPRLSK
eukprot:Skav229517  [mRNA]  locus=scaffold887:33038:42973:+ [translate_table: standard]